MLFIVAQQVSVLFLLHYVYQLVIFIEEVTEGVFVTSVTNHQISKEFNQKASNEKENQAATTFTKYFCPINDSNYCLKKKFQSVVLFFVELSRRRLRAIFTSTSVSFYPYLPSQWSQI